LKINQEIAAMIEMEGTAASPGHLVYFVAEGDEAEEIALPFRGSAGKKSRGNEAFEDGGRR
jgi:hypothetical protein